MNEASVILGIIICGILWEYFIAAFGWCIEQLFGGICELVRVFTRPFRHAYRNFKKELNS